MDDTFFLQALEQYYAGEPDPLTIDTLDNARATIG